MTQAYIGLGSNLGDRRLNLRQALRLIANLPKTEFIAASSLYESPPIDASEQNDFLNAVCEIKTQMKPLELLDKLKQIERQLGRPERYARWAARPIDLDMLFWGSEIVSQESLTVPHPEIPNRKFVLVPLLELADFEHPILKKKLSELLKETSDASRISRLEPL
jgi:2-amino-4-hydroxy-6-hydroxymethyldihydropteridine diphosphokinase